MAHFIFIHPGWPAPKHVRALTTTRVGGVSREKYASFNLGAHVGDIPIVVRRNRALLRNILKLPAEPPVAQADARNEHHRRRLGATRRGSRRRRHESSRRGLRGADGRLSPVFLCDRTGTKAALLHAGWRGLAAGVIESGVQMIGVPRGELLAWLGPGIGPGAYEVGEDVRTAFVAHDADTAAAFRPNGHGRWLADLYALARRRVRGARRARRLRRRLLHVSRARSVLFLPARRRVWAHGLAYLACAPGCCSRRRGPTSSVPGVVSLSQATRAGYDARFPLNHTSRHGYPGYLDYRLHRARRRVERVRRSRLSAAAGGHAHAAAVAAGELRHRHDARRDIPRFATQSRSRRPVSRNRTPSRPRCCSGCWCSSCSKRW